MGDAEALEWWPRVLADLRAIRPELSDLPSVEERRERHEGGYRDPAGETVALRIRQSERGRRGITVMFALSLWWIGMGLVRESLLMRASHLFLGAVLLATAAGALRRARKADAEVLADARSLRVRRGRKVVLDLAREEIAYVEARSPRDDAVDGRRGLFERLGWSTPPRDARVLCAVTTDGEVHWLGSPIDEAAARVLCVAIEDRLELLPSDQSPSLLRVRVAPGHDERRAEPDPLDEQAAEIDGRRAEA